MQTTGTKRYLGSMTELLYCVQIHGSHATEKNEQIITTTQQVTTLHTHTEFKICYERKMQFQIHGIPLLGLKKKS